MATNEKVICDMDDLTAMANAVRLANDSTQTFSVSELKQAVVEGVFSLPTASSDIKGGVKIGSGLQMDGEVLNAEVTQEDVNALYEEIAELKENGTGGGSGASVQSDWSQNDETAPDYIKGRTHWTEIGEGLIEFNGDLTGQETFSNGEGLMFVKMSDRIFTKEELIGSTLAITVLSDDLHQHLGIGRGKHEATIDIDSFDKSAAPGVHIITVFNFMWAFIVYEETPDLPLSCGTWFCYAPDMFYVNSISCLQGPMEVVHKLDPKYFPEGYPYVEVVKGNATFNGDLTGREFVQFDSTHYLVKISDNFLTAANMVGQTLTAYVQGEIQEMVVTEDMVETVPLDENNYFVAIDEQTVISVKGDLSSAGVPITEGTWFMFSDDPDYKIYVVSLSGLTGDVETVHQIDKKFIPEGVGMPVVTAEDNGKFLRVVDGQAAWVAIANAEEATFGE